MKIIVIGATGYVGSALFAKAGLAREVIGTSSQGGHGLVQFTLQAADRFKHVAVERGDFVILTSAISAPDVCKNEPVLARQVNITGTNDVILATLARGAHVIFLSSDTVYGNSEAAVDESSRCHPAGEYAAMKVQVEQQHLDLPGFKSVRLSYVFSKFDKFTQYLGRCADGLVGAEVFDPFDRAVVHRADVVDGILALIGNWKDFPQPVVNMGGPQLVSRIAFSEAIRELVYPKLRIHTVVPPEDFFRNRPHIINMVSPVFDDLLGRPASSIEAAIRLEFGQLESA